MIRVGVLIVDDHEPFRAVARALVERIPGWKVIGEVDTGEKALVAAVKCRPDLILMDIHLPGISGIEATRRIIAETPTVIVSLVSTYAAVDLPADTANCGAACYFRKEELTPMVLTAMLPAR